MYQQIANDCLHLHELGFSYYRIARKLNVDAKMVAKAIGWIRESQSKKTKQIEFCFIRHKIVV